MYDSNKNIIKEKKNNLSQFLQKKNPLFNFFFLNQMSDQAIKNEVKELKEGEEEEECNNSNSEEECNNSNSEEVEEKKDDYEDNLPLIATTNNESSLFKKKKSFIQKWNENEKKYNRKYNKRDIIRGPRSAWIYFLQSNRGQHAVPDLSKPLSLRWKNMTSEERLPYREKEIEDFERYRKEMNSLNDTDKRLLRIIKKRKREEKAKIYPKRRLSAYQLFLREERPIIIKENPTFNFSEIGKEIGSRWKMINAQDKMKFDKLAKKERKRYKMDKEMYQSVLSKEELRKSSAYTCKNSRSQKTLKVPMTLVV